MKSTARPRELSRLAIMVNMVAPYRLPIYEYLARTFDVLVLHGGDESNRQWKPIQSTQPHLRIKKTWSCKIGIKKKIKTGRVQDQQFLHFNLGAVKDLLAFRPHVLISNEMGIRTVVALAYGTLARIPVWIWWGGTLHSEKDINPFKRFCRKLIAQFSKQWISYGITSTEYLESLGVARTAVLEIQNCVDEALYTCAAPEQMVFPIRPAGLVVGQVIARKGLNLLLESCARVQSAGVLFSMTIVGGGKDKSLLEQYGAQLGLKNVIFTGNKTQEQVLTYYKGADFLVFPTLEDTWGLVVNEALLAGLPVLCSKHAGCARELVPEEAQFDPLDHESFDANLTRAICHHLPKPDIIRLKSYRQVGAMIAASLLEGEPTQVVPESWECA
jgi:glycosyltransferase involved in cell wall biosynthesis